jgi:hypothetical protein
MSDSGNQSTRQKLAPLRFCLPWMAWTGLKSRSPRWESRRQSIWATARPCIEVNLEMSHFLVSGPVLFTRKF